MSEQSADDSGPDGLFTRAKALIQQRRVAEALPLIDRALELAPGHSGAWGLKGATLAVLGRDKEAILAYQKCVELMPPENSAAIDKILEHMRLLESGFFDAEDIYNKAVAHFQRKEFEETLNRAQQALAKNPAHYSSLHLCTMALINLERNSEALEYNQKALAINPNDHARWGIQGGCLMKLKRYKEAITAFERYNAIAPPEHVGQIRQAKAFIKQMRKEASWLRRLIS